MSTLLIRLAGPMQSWGTRSRFGVRDTEREPTKSGVVGLICAALGRGRDEPIDDLASLRMGVRVHKPGSVSYDYQTALAVAKASGATPETLPTKRYYLADADFLVGLEGDDQLLERIESALRAPKHPLGLGRRSYVATRPLIPPSSAVRPSQLRQALIDEPLTLTTTRSTPARPNQTVLVYEPTLGDPPGPETRDDVPLSFKLGARRFGSRTLVREFVDLATEQGD